ncbi:hypothetical protein [Aureimonas ureilytica]|uniref:hypothetical protein n=1 Tax=Aureimonas ureilytica TaxID=401562 RepID=UPI0003710C81|nr:hypothetical protein [Aureimonas ureilytica]
MSSSSTDVLIPSPLADYKSPPNLRFSPQVWDAVFKSIGERLRTLEAQKATLEAIIDALQTSALQTVTATITAEIEARRADLTRLEAEFKAVSDAYIELVAGGVYADAIQLRDTVPGVTGHTVQAAITEIATRLATLKKITPATVFLGAS